MSLYFTTDEEVEAEIERLKQNEFVKLSRAEERYRNKRRQYMYTLRMHEKKGKKLAAEGVTLESFTEANEFCEEGC